MYQLLFGEVIGSPNNFEGQRPNSKGIEPSQFDLAQRQHQRGRGGPESQEEEKPRRKPQVLWMRLKMLRGNMASFTLNPVGPAAERVLRGSLGSVPNTPALDACDDGPLQQKFLARFRQQKSSCQISKIGRAHV